MQEERLWGAASPGKPLLLHICPQNQRPEQGQAPCDVCFCLQWFFLAVQCCGLFPTVPRKGSGRRCSKEVKPRHQADTRAQPHGAHLGLFPIQNLYLDGENQDGCDVCQAVCLQRQAACPCTINLAVQGYVAAARWGHYFVFQPIPFFEKVQEGRTNGSERGRSLQIPPPPPEKRLPFPKDAHERGTILYSGQKQLCPQTHRPLRLNSCSWAQELGGGCGWMGKGGQHQGWP